MKIKAVKKPIVFEAVQWTGNNFDEIEEFCGKIELPMKDIPYNDLFSVAYMISAETNITSPTLMIRTLEGDHKAIVGDYIIKGVHGECYPCKKDIFEETYYILRCKIMMNIPKCLKVCETCDHWKEHEWLDNYFCELDIHWWNCDKDTNWKNQQAEKEILNANHEWHKVSDKLPEMDVLVYLWKEDEDFPIVARRHIPYGHKEWIWDCKWGSGYEISQSKAKDYFWKEIILPEISKEN